MSKRFSHARFQRMTSARFVGTSVVSMFVETGIGSVKLVRTPNTSWLDWNKTTRVFEYQSRWFPGLVPSNQGRFLTNDVTAFTGSSMSLLDALPESICLVSLSSRQFGPVPRLPEACRPVLVGLPCLRSARSCARSPGACRPVCWASFSLVSSILCATG